MADGIYNPRIILKALDIERAYTKEHGDEDGLAPNLVFFKIIDKNIVDTIYVPRNEFKNYVPEENVYYLDRTRDSGDDITDYNLEPVGKLYDLWFPIEESVCKRLNKILEQNKEVYLDTDDKTSVIRNFINIHKDLVEPLPKLYTGDRDLEAILYYLGSKDGITARIKTPIETVIFNERNVNHLLIDNEPERLQSLSLIKATLLRPNLIIETLEPGVKHNYIKAFGNQDIVKSQLVVVKILDDGTFYITSFRLKNRKFLDKLKEGQIIYDLSDTYANKSEDLSYNYILTKKEENVKPYYESICKKLNRLINEALNESIFKAPTLEQFLDICNKANIQIDLEETDNKVDKVDYPIDVDIYTVDYETCILDSYSYKQLLNKLVDTLKLELGDYIGDSIDKNYLLKCMGEEPYCLTEVIDKLNENRLDYNRIYKFEYITEVQGEQTKYTIIKMLDL